MPLGIPFLTCDYFPIFSIICPKFLQQIWMWYKFLYIYLPSWHIPTFLYFSFFPILFLTQQAVLISHFLHIVDNFPYFYLLCNLYLIFHNLCYSSSSSILFGHTTSLIFPMFRTLLRFLNFFLIVFISHHQKGCLDLTLHVHVS